MNSLPLTLIIIDGFGLAPDSASNAISRAKTPTLDRLWNEYPHAELAASGLAVGLPAGVMGNSEVGHLNIGAGRVVKQSLVKINDAIANNQLIDNPTLNQAFTDAKKTNRLHLLGLASDGGVHSHIDHLIALVNYAKQAGIDNIFIHAITDGRDTDPNSGIDFIQQLNLALIEIGTGKIATVSGRYYAMDRDKRWDRTGKYYDAISKGLANRVSSAEEAISSAYDNGQTDEFIEPVIINDAGLIQSQDTIICFNFRPDRMRQIVSVLENPTPLGGVEDVDLKIYTMTKYDDDLQAKVLFPKEIIKQTLGQVIAQADLSQARIAETEKYAHVTYFINGGYEQEFKNEHRTVVPSPKVATYDMQPEMSAVAVADTVIKDLNNQTSDVIIVNFANCDMVGHTGDMEATIKAIETVDQQIARILDVTNGTVLITADHGNAEQMLTANNEPVTTHSTNLVPLMTNRTDISFKPQGKLADVAPTILDLIDLKKPAEMTGESLIDYAI